MNVDAELRDLLRQAQHPVLRRAYAALSRANPPTNWAELASRVEHTPGYLRALIEREVSERVNRTQ